MVAGQQNRTGVHIRQAGDHILAFRAQHVGKGDHTDAILPIRHKHGGLSLGAQLLQYGSYGSARGHPVFP